MKNILSYKLFESESLYVEIPEMEWRNLWLEKTPNHRNRNLTIPIPESDKREIGKYLDGTGCKWWIAPYTLEYAKEFNIEWDNISVDVGEDGFAYISVTLIEDGWYLVKCARGRGFTRDRFWKCDQVHGLLSLLKLLMK
jgi:hypothetical protein